MDPGCRWAADATGYAECRDGKNRTEPRWRPIEPRSRGGRLRPEQTSRLNSGVRGGHRLERRVLL